MTRPSVRSTSTVIMVSAGILMVGLWIIFTIVHGPTSFDQRGEILGRSTPFWGTLLGVVPNLLVSFSWILLYPLVAKSSSLARVGYWMTLIGLMIPAALDLVTGELGPPLLLPVLGLGMILTGIGNRARVGRAPSITLQAVGGVLIAAFLFTILLPDHLFDRIDAFRVFGVGAFVFQGVGWVVFGLSLPTSLSTEPAWVRL